MVRFQLIFVANKVETGQVEKVFNEQVTKRSRHAVAIDLYIHDVLSVPQSSSKLSS